MRARRILSAALLTTAVVGLPASSARADGFGTIEVSPKTAKPGDSVTLSTAHCGPGATSANGDSAAGGAFTLRPGTDGAHKDVLVGRFTVPNDTKPGTYGIGVQCPNGTEATGDLIITHRAGVRPRQLSPPPTQPAANTSAQPTVPPKAAQGGVGGSQGGVSPTEAALGASVLAAAAVGGLCVVRHRIRRGKA